MKQKPEQNITNPSGLQTAIPTILKVVSPLLFSMLTVGFLVFSASIITVFGNASQSANVSITAVVPGEEERAVFGFSAMTEEQATVAFQGYGPATSKVTLLVDGNINTTVTSNNDGSFQLVLNSVPFGNYQYSLFIEDKTGEVSSAAVINASVFDSQPYIFSGIIIPPTVNASILTVQKDGTFTIQGYAVPGSVVRIEVPGLKQMGMVTAGIDGYYQTQITADINAGVYAFRATATFNGITSAYSAPLQILVYNPEDMEQAPIAPAQLQSCIDVNRDTSINLVDFSILLFWYEKNNPPENLDCNADNRVDLTDFSILMYFWTG